MNSAPAGGPTGRATFKDPQAERTAAVRRRRADSAAPDAAGISVEPLRHGRDLDLFARFPWQIYRDDPDWVPPLLADFKKFFDPKQHPFYEHSECRPFLARRNGEVVGRIAAIWNKNHQKFHDEPVGFFGFFECIDDHDVAMALFARAEAWLKERGLNVMRGPASFSSNEEWGLLIDGWNGPPRVMMPYNPRYYPPLIEGCGFAKVKDLVAYHFMGTGVPERLARGTDIVAKRNPDVIIRPLNMKKFNAELTIVRELYNRCWERNWGFVPMTEAEIDHMAKELKPVINPALVLIMEKAGVPIGFSLTLPDLYLAQKHANGRYFPFGLLKMLWHARKIRTVRVLTLGIVPEYRHGGLDALLYRQLMETSYARGIPGGEFSWMLEDNIAIKKPMENLGASIYRTYRLYDRRLYDGPVA